MLTPQEFGGGVLRNKVHSDTSLRANNSPAQVHCRSAAVIAWRAFRGCLRVGGAAV